MQERLEAQMAAAQASAQEKRRSDEVTISVCSPPHVCTPAGLQHLACRFQPSHAASLTHICLVLEDSLLVSPVNVAVASTSRSLQYLTLVSC